MSNKKAKYELLNEQNYLRYQSNTTRKSFCLQICLLVSLCALFSLAVYVTWDLIYRDINLLVPPKNYDIPQLWVNRLHSYSTYDQINKTRSTTKDDIPESESILPSKLGNFVYSREEEKLQNSSNKLICYYATPDLTLEQNKGQKLKNLFPHNINPYLCTHINVGIVRIVNCSLEITPNLKEAFRQIDTLKGRNGQLKILLWVGGGADSSDGFPEMVRTHANRKIFIQSLKAVLEMFSLDGIDIDWEFPNGFTLERIKFSQLLHEIRREYQREHRTYLLSVAVAAPSTFIDMSYNVEQINMHVDYVNVMTYDYHFYSKQTPWTGLNAPLYAKKSERGFFSTLNINYTVNYWMQKGLEKHKIIIGLPTYGHSYHLVNPFNPRLGAPAQDSGEVGMLGFATYSDVCWFQKYNLYVKTEYDAETCSPYLYTGTEWISYDSEASIECKTRYIKENNFGGAFVFSLNTDDFNESCNQEPSGATTDSQKFPLLRRVHSILFQNQTN